MLWECREISPCHCELAIPTCIMACASRTCRDACQDRYPAASFEVSGRENVPRIPDAYATHNFTYLVRGPFVSIMHNDGWLLPLPGHNQARYWLPCLIFLNLLRAKFFRGTKHIFTFYVIPLYLFGTGSWNPSSSKTRTYLFYIVNIIAADVLVTKGAMASATMILT